jgi:segregation and condensation protein A
LIRSKQGELLAVKGYANGTLSGESSGGFSGFLASNRTVAILIRTPVRSSEDSIDDTNPFVEFGWRAEVWSGCIDHGKMSDYRVQAEIFEGPMDLLLHLVKKQEVDIYRVNLTKIATEFVSYIEQMRELDLDIAGEFLVMAATLIYIKSRELLPVDQQVKPEGDELEDGNDPRWELIRRLVEYKKFKDVASDLQAMEFKQERTYERKGPRPELEVPPPEVRRGTATLFDLISAVSQVLKRFGERTDTSEIYADPYTVSEKLDTLRVWLNERPVIRFSEIFASARARSEVVVTFLAVLELIRLKQIVALQSEEFGDIEIARSPEPLPEA